MLIILGVYTVALWAIFLKFRLVKLGWASGSASRRTDPFIVEEAITMVALFSQNGFQTVKEGAAIDIAFDNIPGRIYHAHVIAIPKGIGQGEVAVSGTLAKTGAIGGATTFPAVISIPDDMDRDTLQLGMAGTATAFSPKAGVIGLLASIPVWIRSYTAYL